MESVEHYFLKYAFPCAFVLVQQGKITEEKRLALETALLNKTPLDKSELELLFPSAFRRIKQVAIQLNKPIWDRSIIEVYFKEFHNKFIDGKEGFYSKTPPSFREFCKVHRVKIIMRNETTAKVEYLEPNDNINRPKHMIVKLIPNVKVGDIVFTHLGYLIEIANSNWD
ncbi:hypothetical protein HN587_05190 [Candidatus Woesearchaeota archaeon]|jgi:hypothetical protein|nr:hypothetical protein [Candidatus Woesearchaeota archaeon]